MTLLFVLLALGVVGVVAAVAAGRITGGLDDPASSVPARGLPEGPVGAEELSAVRFSPALRGYRMEEVDRVLDRLTDELRRRDEELASLRTPQVARTGPPAGDGPPFSRASQGPFDGLPAREPWPLDRPLDGPSDRPLDGPSDTSSDWSSDRER